ncbi:hypothetical protein IM717_14530 [Bacillus velezensis]|jgi:gas vesicle protein|uniref:hypothetical protein n=1 Tax=Bacillus TaxID=1386 RepID=UPI000501052D|nr:MULTISPECIES: hypothetical protein [Bacillus]ARM27031.1 hypothetical protein B9C48_03990 [Bacillus vallismortis]ANF35678.1 hypothetical protein BCBMB205_07760 [Bacillus velezensis]ANS37565.1 hypothetical protein A5891_03910 [Bacillus velezensis]ANU29326.1 hypothetical protein A8142_03770 [Bacillus velezensis]APQ49988.1 hypothetical protein BSO20_07960 [Bacillus amyloliquefaciens]
MKQTRIMAKAILIGAAAGGALSLLHKPTREGCFRNMDACRRRAAFYRKHPEALKQQASAKLDQVKIIANTVSEDLSFLNGQITKLKQTTPQVIDLLKETKEHFSKNDH